MFRSIVPLILVLSAFLCSAGLQAEPRKDDKTFVVAIYHPMMVNPIQGPWAVRKHIVEQAGYKIEYRVVPAKRMPYDLANGSVDAISVSSLARDIRQKVEDDGFLQAQYPDRVTITHIYYRKNSDWTPSWPAQGNFLNKAKGVTINFNYMTEMGLNINQIPGYQSGVFMINYNRADYWLDNIPHYSPTFNKFKKAETEGFVKEPLFDNPLFLLFADTQRGRDFKSMIDQGMNALLRNPEEYRQVWNANQQAFTDSVEDYLDYMMKTYPELNRGEQIAYQP